MSLFQESSNEEATAARSKFLTLLSTRPATEKRRDGWVEPDIHLQQVFKRNPRKRGGILTELVAKARNEPVESYTVAGRARTLGTLPVYSWYAGKTTNMLYTGDALYTPSDPVDGKTDTARATYALYKFYASEDEVGRPSQLGINFNFLEIGDDKEIHAHAGLHVISADHRLIATHLEQNGLNPELDANSIVDLADFCIEQAYRAS